MGILKEKDMPEIVLCRIFVHMPEIWVLKSNSKNPCVNSFARNEIIDASISRKLCLHSLHG